MVRGVVVGGSRHVISGGPLFSFKRGWDIWGFQGNCKGGWGRDNQDLSVIPALSKVLAVLCSLLPFTQFS